jgi:RNA polymerase sigma-70 factor, ECF subfamily
MMALTSTQPPSPSFDALFRESMSDVHAYVLGLLRDRAAAEDVTAAAFERAWRRRGSFDPRRGTERAWLFAIARNAALDELRRRKRTAALAVDPEDPAAAAAFDGGEDDEAAARRATVRAAVAALPARERELVGLKFGAGLTTAEIAHVLGCSERAAAMRVHRAMTALREACHVPA